jgi:hypothetical protein
MGEWSCEGERRGNSKNSGTADLVPSCRIDIAKDRSSDPDGRPLLLINVAFAHVSFLNSATCQRSLSLGEAFSITN